MAPPASTGMETSPAGAGLAGSMVAVPAGRLGARRADFFAAFFAFAFFTGRLRVTAFFLLLAVTFFLLGAAFFFARFLAMGLLLRDREGSTAHRC